MSETPPRSAPIERSWPTTLLFFGFGMLLLAGAFLLFQAEHEVWSILVGIIGALMTYGAVFGSGTALCPHCGKRLVQLAAGTSEGCDGCGIYYDVVSGQIVEIDTERVSDTLDFAARLPDSWVMPPLCCYCGKPAEREEQITITLSSPAESSFGLMRELVTHGLRVPHCAAHSGGAKLDRKVPTPELNSDTLTGTSGPIEPFTVLKVRSYKFYLSFIAANRLFSASTNKVVANENDS